MADRAAEKTPTSPAYWMVMGVVVAVVGVALNSATDSNIAPFFLVLGAAAFVFGIIAKAVQVGVQSSKRD